MTAHSSTVLRSGATSTSAIRPSGPARRAGMRRRQLVGDVASHVFLGLMAVIWLVPIVWVLLESFNKNTAPYTTTFFPTQYTFGNYVKLMTDRSVMNFPVMFGRTLVIASAVCVINLFFVLSVGFVMSRLRFRMRRAFMNTLPWVIASPR